MASLYACLQGTAVSIDALTGPFRACPHCGGKAARLNIKASGFHIAELICSGCGGHTSWLGRDHMAALLAVQRGAAA